VENFQDALKMTGFTDALSDEVKSVILGLAGAFGVIPAALGFAFEAVFREAAIYVLVATIPITAAGLVSNSTTRWYWKVFRWVLVAVVMKPALAFVLTLAIAIVGGAQGLSGLLAGIGVLLVALCVPLALFKLFAFVDPNADPGGVFRDKLSDAGLDSYGDDSIAGRAGSALWNKLRKTFGSDDDNGTDTDAQEQANVDRFDQAADDDAAAESDPAAGSGDPAAEDREPSSPSSHGETSTAGASGEREPVTDAVSEATDPPSPSGDGKLRGAGVTAPGGDGDDSDSVSPDPPGDVGPPTPPAPPVPKSDGEPPDDDDDDGPAAAEESAVVL
jgi:hypothetical protein